MSGGTRGAATGGVEQVRAYQELVINCETRDARLLEGETFFPEAKGGVGQKAPAKPNAQPVQPTRTSERQATSGS